MENEKTNKLTGRSKMNEHEKRSRIISVRLNKNEEFILLNKSKQAHLDLSALLRKSALNKEIKQRMSDEDRKILRNIISLSNSANTLAKNSYKQNMLSMMRELIELRDNINKLIDQLHDK